MKNKYRLSLTVITVLLLIAISIGASYGFWLVSKDQTSGNVLTALTCFEISTTGSTASLADDTLVPMSDQEGALTTPAVISATNNCSYPISYNILIHTVNKGAPINEAYMRFNLTGSKTVGPALLTSLSIIENYSSIHVADPILNTYVITTDSLNAGATKSYNFRAWIKEDNLTYTDVGGGLMVEGYDLMNKNFTAVITIEANSSL